MANLFVSGMAGIAVLFVSPTFARPAQPTQPAQAAPPPAQDIWQAETLSGNWGGLRSRLKDRGLEFTITETAEMFAA